MPDYKAAISGYVKRAREVLAGLDAAEVESVAKILKSAYDDGRNIFIMGNGGSGSTASHFACDMNKGACFHAEKKFRVIALTDNMATILALGNDAGYESVFVEQLKNFACKGDVVIGISGSGNSENVLRAIAHAKSLGCTTVGLVGFDGGKLKPLVDCCVHVRSNDMQIVEDLHLMVGHILMQALDAGGGAC